MPIQHAPNQILIHEGQRQKERQVNRRHDHENSEHMGQRQFHSMGQSPDQKMTRKKITVLGSTGTIGCNTLDLIGRSPEDYEVIALCANQNIEKLAEQARLFKPEIVVVAEPEKYQDLKNLLSGTGIEVAAGQEAVIEAAARPADWIMAAIVGAAGLRPTLEAVRQGRCVALANKECLVSAGPLFQAEVKKAKTVLLPVDSEHSAIFQTLQGHSGAGMEKMTLTASGGPFFDWTLEQLKTVTPEQALKHPNWSMGAKITIDSATMMNKGLELIEAFHLFPVRVDQLDVLVHPQSIIHSLVSFEDGSVLAQMSSPDMRTPIAYSLSWPHRMSAPTRRLDLAQIGQLTFFKPDENRFPALRIARGVLENEGIDGPVLNAANEIAVEAFLKGQLDFLGIAALVEDTIEAYKGRTGLCKGSSLQDILDIDADVRVLARALLEKSSVGSYN